MAIQTKTVQDYMGLGGLDWKTMGGGAGGAVGGTTGSGFGTALVGALATGAALAAGAAGTGTKKPNTATSLPELDKTVALPDTAGTNNNNNNEEENKNKDPLPNIKDTTNENVETTISGSGLDYALKWAEEQQKAQWEREDTIRRETQEREDTAYQRAVEDMRAAGINPNLVGVNPAASGGGITSATGANLELYQAEMNKYLQELDQMFQKNFKGSENDQDRFMELISDAIQLYSVIKMFGGK